MRHLLDQFLMETTRNDRKGCKCAYTANMFSWETYSLFNKECWKI